MSATRTVHLIGDRPSDDMALTQRAIPWCTTHNLQAMLMTMDPDEMVACSRNHLDCVVSSGGPDHKWWADD